MNLELRIQKSDDLSDGFFTVSAVFPRALEYELAAIGEEIGEGNWHDLRGVRLRFEEIGVVNGEIMNGCGEIGDLWFYLEPSEEGLEITFSCRKVFEGEDALDQYGSSKSGDLPDLFWVEPARVMRALLAGKH